MTLLLSVAMAGTVWVAHPAFPTRALDKVVKQAEKQGALASPIAAGAWCLAFDGDVDPDWVARANKRLGVALEERTGCAEARYPKGTGWLVAVIGADPTLQKRLEPVEDGLNATVLAQPLDGRPATFCVNGMQVDQTRLRERLKAVNVDLLGIFDVGACTTRSPSPPI